MHLYAVRIVRKSQCVCHFFPSTISLHFSFSLSRLRLFSLLLTLLSAHRLSAAKRISVRTKNGYYKMAITTRCHLDMLAYKVKTDARSGNAADAFIVTEKTTPTCVWLFVENRCMGAQHIHTHSMHSFPFCSRHSRNSTPKVCTIYA